MPDMSGKRLIADIHVQLQIYWNTCSSVAVGLNDCALHIAGGHLPSHGQADEGRLGGAHARHQRSLAGAPAAATLHVLLIRCALQPPVPSWGCYVEASSEQHRASSARRSCCIMLAWLTHSFLLPVGVPC